MAVIGISVPLFVICPVLQLVFMHESRVAAHLWLVFLRGFLEDNNHACLRSFILLFCQHHKAYEILYARDLEKRLYKDSQGEGHENKPDHLQACHEGSYASCRKLPKGPPLLES